MKESKKNQGASELINQIREKLDIVSIIRRYIKLTKRGAKYVGYCPFHAGQDLSFTADKGKSLYHCFGCGDGGDVFTFIMKKHAMTFPNALRHLCKLAGIEPPKQTKKQTEETNEKINERYDRKWDSLQALDNLIKDTHQFFSELLDLYNEWERDGVTDKAFAHKGRELLEGHRKLHWTINETVNYFGRLWDVILEENPQDSAHIRKDKFEDDVPF